MPRRSISFDWQSVRGAGARFYWILLLWELGMLDGANTENYTNRDRCGFLNERVWTGFTRSPVPAGLNGH